MLLLPLHLFCRDTVQRLHTTFIELLLRIKNNMLCFTQTTLLARRVTLNANRICRVLYSFLHLRAIESHHHARKIVRREARESMLDEGLGCGLRVFDVADEVYRFLV